MDSLQGAFFEVGVEDCNTRKAPAMARTVKKSCIVCFNLMFGWLLTFDAGSGINVTAKVKR